MEFIIVHLPNPIGRTVRAIKHPDQADWQWTNRQGTEFGHFLTDEDLAQSVSTDKRVEDVLSIAWNAVMRRTRKVAV